jgi:hypothetical protein
MARLLPILMLLSLPLVGRLTETSPAAHGTTPQQSVQNTAPQAGGEFASEQPKTFDLYALERQINAGEVRLGELWQALGIEGGDFPDECDSCRAEQLQLDLDGELEDISILKVAVIYETRYLFFRHKPAATGESRQEFLGHADSLYQQYGPPEHRVVRGENGSWLVVRELWGRGTGFLHYGEVWYGISHRGPKEVLRYPVRGHDAMIARVTNRQIKVWAVGPDVVNDTSTVKVIFTVTYLGFPQGEDDRPLFTKKQKALYVWDAVQEKFVLDAYRSELTEEEIEAVYNFDSLDDEKFVEYNYDELTRVATQGGAERKRLLRKFLNTLPASSKAQSLLRTLSRP